MFTTNNRILEQFVTENRVWQGIPGIERTSKGRLFATFYSGTTSLLFFQRMRVKHGLISFCSMSETRCLILI